MRRSGIVAAGLALALAAPVRACPGDCNGDGAVGVDELVRGIAIALGQAAVGTCVAADTNADGAVAINELVAATQALLAGCPPGTPPTATPPLTATPTATATAMPTNQPVALDAFVYRGFAGEPIARPLGVIDPEGGDVTCTAGALPAGMTFDGEVFAWTPAAAQVGLVGVPVTCRDDGQPPAITEGVLDFRIAPRAACAQPVCDAATGCTTLLPPLDAPCCDDGARPRVAETVRQCPHDRVLLIGRNAGVTFGHLTDCDWLRFRPRAQSSATLTFHIRASCISVAVRPRVHVRLENATRGVITDEEALITIGQTPIDGFYERRNITVPLEVDGPFFDIEDGEANLTVTVRDGNQVTVSETVRVRLTSEVIADLPEP